MEFADCFAFPAAFRALSAAIFVFIIAFCSIFREALFSATVFVFTFAAALFAISALLFAFAMTLFIFIGLESISFTAFTWVEEDTISACSGRGFTFTFAILTN